MGKNALVYTNQIVADPTAVMGRRIAAYLIDGFLFLIVFVVAFIALSDKNPISAGNFRPFASCQQIRDAGGSSLCFKAGDNIRYAQGGTAASIIGIAIAFNIVNLLIFQALSGTIGKRLVGLAVVRQDTGKALGFGWAFVRWIVSVVDVGCCFLVGLIMALTVKGHRRLGDLAAGSVVVDKSSVGTIPSYPGHETAMPPPMATPPPMGWSPASAAPWAPPAPAAPWAQPPTSTAPVDPWTPPAAPADSWTPPVAPTPSWDEPAVTTPQPQQAAPPEPSSNSATDTAASVGADTSASGPQWDAARNAYIQWEPVSGQWMQFDDAAQEWRPIS